MKINKRNKSNPSRYTYRFNRLSNSTKQVNNLKSKRGGIKL